MLDPDEYKLDSCDEQIAAMAAIIVAAEANRGGIVKVSDEHAKQAVKLAKTIIRLVAEPKS